MNRRGHRILLVEDDASLGASLETLLLQENYAVTRAASIVDAERAFGAEPDLIILDWMLPDGQGIDLLRGYRAKGGTAPVILLTARAELIDKVLGLETGANDYLTKPFEPRELIARVRVQLRSPSAGASTPTLSTQTLRAGALELDLSTRKARLDGRELPALSKMEFELLRVLCESPNRVFSREELLNKVWGYQNFPTTRTVDTHILQLRTKVGEDLFETVRGVGYRLKA